MNVKNIDLLRCVAPMRILSEKDGIPFPAALALSKNISSIDGAIENYLAKKEEINNEFLEDGAESKRVKTGFEEEYLKKLTELNDLTVSLEIELMSPAAFADITFKPKYIESIAFMLDI